MVPRPAGAAIACLLLTLAAAAVVPASAQGDASSTGTISESMSISPSPSASDSASPSASPGSGSAPPTATDTAAATPSPSHTVTDSSSTSISASASNAASGSATVTASATESPGSITPSPSSSLSASESASPSPSATASESAASSASSSVSVSASSSPSLTASESASPTASSTHSVSSSATGTRSTSATLSATNSLTPTPTDTGSESGTPSESASETETPTETASDSETPSESASDSESPSETGSASCTGTHSPAASRSPSNTASPSPIRVVFTPSPSPSHTPRCNPACADGSCTVFGGGPDTCTGSCGEGFVTSSGGGCEVANTAVFELVLAAEVACGVLPSASFTTPDLLAFIAQVAAGLYIAPAQVSILGVACSDRGRRLSAAMLTFMFQAGSLTATDTAGLQTALPSLPYHIAPVALDGRALTVASATLTSLANVCDSSCSACFDVGPSACTACFGGYALSGPAPAACVSSSLVSAGGGEGGRGASFGTAAVGVTAALSTALLIGVVIVGATAYWRRVLAKQKEMSKGSAALPLGWSDSEGEGEGEAAPYCDPRRGDAYAGTRVMDMQVLRSPMRASRRDSMESEGDEDTPQSLHVTLSREGLRAGGKPGAVLPVQGPAGGACRWLEGGVEVSEGEDFGDAPSPAPGLAAVAGEERGTPVSTASASGGRRRRKARLPSGSGGAASSASPRRLKRRVRTPRTARPRWLTDSRLGAGTPMSEAGTDTPTGGDSPATQLDAVVVEEECAGGDDVHLSFTRVNAGKRRQHSSSRASSQAGETPPLLSHSVTASSATPQRRASQSPLKSSRASGTPRAHTPTAAAGSARGFTAVTPRADSNASLPSPTRAAPPKSPSWHAIKQSVAERKSPHSRSRASPVAKP